ncbi:MFS monocarboxylate transporter-like protein [Mollisia scopiformis]|uniref:MFS monocarboxylate transporter-like protein n=1 Tax=Mollisia scopiformis TaxID=149040 RepID=A0A132BBK3_MOLSC|nr:MFS monocarboxylate transporter-like protein [Mollisia scopiformis]KUJ09758.1 MFS monocarboxylate transporter-like protein [Mollisia scopiformis]
MEEKPDSEPQDLEESQPKSIPPSSTRLALLQVLGSFFLMFNSWGVANTFGAYQIYYEANLLKDESPSNISWIGSIQAFMLLIVGGIVTGPIFDAGYLRALVFTGSFLVVFGMMMTSICHEYWQIILAQGIVVGAGAGCMMLPSIAVMPQYFKTRRAFATGVAASGSSLGGIIYPIVFHKLQPQIGFGWATRIIGFIALATLMVPIIFMRAKVFPAQKRPLVDFKVLRDVPWVLFSIGAFFGFIGMYIPFYYISTYSVEKGFVDENLAFYLLTMLNAGSIFGRIVPSFFADRLGPLNITAPWCLFCGIIAFSWLSVSSLGQAVAFSLFYGFFSGTFVSICGPALVTLSPDLSLVGTHMGMSFTFCALGLLIGNPVAGSLLTTYGWIGPAMFCGTANVLAAIFVWLSRVKKSGWNVTVKA